ncbi:MAG: radical SAM protein [Bacteroidales bacterium]|jgi:MoaA/NifB/PqqE/SkfB family radical SAM enzyme|nr:radical SAM protein [Bacteroidales bacterium]
MNNHPKPISSTSSFQKISTKRKLESIFLFVTGKCNARCAMCFYSGDMDIKKEDLTFDEMKKISETAGEFNRLWLSGGEPTLRTDLPEILEMFYKNNKIKDINFPTNGLMPDRVVEWVTRFRRNCPNCMITVSVSLDGFEETHDVQRGVPGNFYKALETLKKVTHNFGKDPRVMTNIATVITKYNYEQIYDFMVWVYGRFNMATHTIEAARGLTREEGVKILTEASLKKLQDEVSPIYSGYAERMKAKTEGLRGKITKIFYLGLMRTLYNVRADNIDKPTPWGMDCTAGETTLVIDYDGRFRSCELRESIGNVKDYECNVTDIIHSVAMKKEIGEIGHGYKANCWCTHGCWIMSSIVFNPCKMISSVYKGYRQSKKINKPLSFINENHLRNLEEKYKLDKEKLSQLNKKFIL